MKAYTVNNHLVGVGNSQILGTDQGGGGGVEYEAGQYISIDENNVISVTGVAPATALPTTELGKFTIQNNVSGGPIEVIVPTDDLRAASGIVIDNTAVSGCAITGNGPIMVFKSPGFDQGYWNGSSEYTLVIDLPEPISYGHAFMWCYAPNNNPTSIGYTATLDSSTTDTHFEAVMSTRHTYGETYGQYLQLFIPSNPSDYETGLSILEGATIKILGPKPIGGIKVDLDRYYLGNTSTITNISGYTQAYVYTDPTSKKQSVYLPGSIPYSWRDNVVNIIKYGSTANPNTSSIIYTGAYKEITGGWTPEYQWAICVDNNASTKIATYISYDKDGNAIEKWTYNWGTSPRTWTTETIETGSEYEAGDYISIASGTISVTGVAPASAIPETEEVEFEELDLSDYALASAIPAAQVNSDWNANSGVAEILNKPAEIQLIAGTNVQVEVTGASAIISAQGGGGGHEYTAGPGIEINNYEISTTELASGLNLVAGDNVTMTVSGNNLVFSAAKGVTKTLLYTGSSSDSRAGSFALSQSAYNFDRLEMTLIDVNNFVIKQVCEMPADGLVNSNGTRGSAFNSITSGTQTWFKAMNWQINAAGTTLTYWVDEIATSGNSISAINRDQTGNRPIMLRIYGVND